LLSLVDQRFISSVHVIGQIIDYFCITIKKKRNSFVLYYFCCIDSKLSQFFTILMIHFVANTLSNFLLTGYHFTQLFQALILLCE